jgi:phytanoyl-CoA hydroxylase
VDADLETSPPRVAAPAAYPRCPDAIAASDAARFQSDGFVAFEQVLSADEVEEARRATSELVRAAFDTGRTCSLGDGKFVERDRAHGGERFYVQYEAGTDGSLLTPETCETHVRKLMWFVDQHPFFRHLIHEHAKVRMLLGRLLDPGFLLFQEMMLVKPARIGGARVWHQDCAYSAVKPLQAVIGIWIALDDANAENGCMHVIPGGHRGGPLLQNSSVNCTIPDDRLDLRRVAPVQLRAGGAMVLSGLLPHMTPANRSPSRRRAIQFHVRHPLSEIVTQEEYARIFAEADGTPAACSSWQYRR